MQFKKISLEVIRKTNQKMIDKGIVDRHYKTIHENKNDLEQFYKEDSIIEKMKIPALIYNLKISILSLDRYSEVYERGTGVLENKDGEYVKLEEVLNLFSAKNS